tara:strand:+ start:2265 stop:2561 length:297 start_codon:yes stop_codon:yes gene_type:complete
MAMKKKGYRSGGKVKRMSKGGAMGGKMRRMSKGGAAGGKKIIKRTGGGSVKAASRTSPSTAKANKMGAQMMQRAKTLEDKDFQKAYNYIMKMVEKKKK